jgi:hypothetical protein
VNVPSLRTRPAVTTLLPLTARTAMAPILVDTLPVNT